MSVSATADNRGLFREYPGHESKWLIHPIHTGTDLFAVAPVHRTIAMERARDSGCG